MAQLIANNIEIEVEDHGDPSNPAVLLIMGLAAQLTLWPPALIQHLVDEGYRVIAFDNRDVGLSKKLHTKRAPKPQLMILAGRLGLNGLAPYRLNDMAADAVGVLDALNVKDAHVVGASMGGMIAQIMAAEHPTRVKSLTAWMSSTNNPKLPAADPSISKAVLNARTRAHSQTDLIDQTTALWTLIGTKNSGVDPEEMRKRVTVSLERCNYPAGIRRQIAAIVATGDLRSWTRKISAPTLVIHGSADPLVPHPAGEDIAANIKGSRFELLEGMGHDVPPSHLPQINQLIADHFRAVEENAASIQAA
ncbi:MAG: alpha/beta hydrolase [Pseudomonadota bacterium]